MERCFSTARKRTVNVKAAVMKPSIRTPCPGEIPGASEQLTENLPGRAALRIAEAVMAPRIFRASYGLSVGLVRMMWGRMRRTSWMNKNRRADEEITSAQTYKKNLLSTIKGPKLEYNRIRMEARPNFKYVHACV